MLRIIAGGVPNDIEVDDAGRVCLRTRKVHITAPPKPGYRPSPSAVDAQEIFFDAAVARLQRIIDGVSSVDPIQVTRISTTQVSATQVSAT